MKGIIIYKSKYGSTKKYAEWLKDATGYDCVATKDADTGKLSSYDTIVFMGGVYAKGIACTSFMKKVISRIKDKKIAVFICAASPYDEKFFNELVALNMKGDLEGVPYSTAEAGSILRT